MTITWTRTGWAVIAAGLVVFAAVAMLALGTGPSAAEPEPIAIEPLTEPAGNEFTDDVRAQVRAKPDGRPMGVANLRDASNLAVLRITIQPGAQFPWHTHPGPVLVAITEGGSGDAFTFVFADDCVERNYAVGEAFVDLGQDVHTAYNPNDDPTEVIATFLGADGPLTVPVSPDEGTALDAKCFGDEG